MDAKVPGYLMSTVKESDAKTAYNALMDFAKVVKAIGKMISMGAAMDSGALQEAARAHVKAIGGMDAKGVLTEADFAAINAGLGKAIASVPTSKVMDVYNAVGGVA